MSEGSRKNIANSSEQQAQISRIIRETAEVCGEDEATIRNVVELFFEAAAHKISQGKEVRLPTGGWLRAGIVNGEIQVVFEPPRHP